MIRKIASIALLGLTLAACATTSRYDAGGDVHALLVAIRDNDRTQFERYVDRRALKNSLESRVMREVGKRDMDDGVRALAAIVAPGLADVAVDGLVRPETFRAAASYYGYTPDQPIPNRLAISGALRYRPDGSVCATKKKDGPCLLVFTNAGGTWRLSGFEGELSDLRGQPRKTK